MGIAQQPFDGQGSMLCLGCEESIKHEDFWIEIRQCDERDADPRLAVHVGCLDRL